MMCYSDDVHLLIAPELASNEWQRGFYAADLIEKYNEIVLTALIMGRPIIIPTAALETLEHEVRSPYDVIGKKAAVLCDCLSMLRDEGHLIVQAFTEDVKWAEEMAEADMTAAEEKGLVFCSGGKTIYVSMPETGEKCCLLSGHSGGYQKLGATANFVLLAQQGFGVEHMEIRAQADFDLLRYLRLKAVLWDVDLNACSSFLMNARNVLSFYLPFYNNHRSFLDLELLRRIIRLRRNVADELDGWRHSLAILHRETLADKMNERQTLIQLPLSVSKALQHEMRHYTYESLSIHGIITLISIPHHVISLLLKPFVMGYEFLQMKKIEKNIPFLFWIQQVKTVMEQSHADSAEIDRGE
jgi:hypothetical protein